MVIAALLAPALAGGAGRRKSPRSTPTRCWGEQLRASQRALAAYAGVAGAPRAKRVGARATGSEALRAARRAPAAAGDRRASRPR